MRIAVAVVALAAFSRLAAPNPGDARARTHYEAGHALYRLGNYSEAIREFLAGYELAPKPQFLIDAGQAYRKLGDIERARSLYQKFLVVAPERDPDREYVRRLLAELPEAVSPPPPLASPRAPPMPAPAAAPTPAPVIGKVLSTAPALEAPARKSFVVRHWWIFPVSAVVLAAAATGIYFAARSGSDCRSGLGCFDFPSR